MIKLGWVSGGGGRGGYLLFDRYIYCNSIPVYCLLSGGVRVRGSEGGVRLGSGFWN